MNITPVKSFTYLFNGLFIGVLTPGRLGEFSRILYLKREGMEVIPAFISVIIDRVTDLLFLITVGGCGAIIVLGIFYITDIAILLILMMVFIAIIFFLIIKYRKKLIKAVSNILLPEKYKQKAKTIYSDTVNEISGFGLKEYAIVGSMTFGSWITYYLMTYFLAVSIGIRINLLYIAFIVSISAIITLLPITINGIGTRDATLIFLLSLFGYSQEMALAFSFLILAITLSVIILGVITWFIDPLPLKEIRNKNNIS
jgi:uncharacterized protein (TIRG00374 family)